jgi:hypothetical protein
LSKILDYDLAHVAICVADLKQSGGIKEDEDGGLYHYKVWRGLHPERRGRVKHIGTVPQAVLEHPDMTGGRLEVAHALSGHFYRNRTAHAKARAIGYREMGVNKATAMRAIHWLLGEGLLELVRADIGSRGREYRWSAKARLYEPKRKKER